MEKVFCDIDKRNLLFATEGKDSATAGVFKAGFEDAPGLLR